MFQNTLVDIKDKIEPVLRTANKDSVNSIQRDEKDKKHEENKSRWEKDVKVTIKEEIVEDSIKISDIYKIEEEQSNEDMN